MYFFTLICATVLLSVQAQNFAQSSAQSSAQSYAGSGNPYNREYNRGVYRPCPNLNPACIAQWLDWNSNCRVNTRPVNTAQVFTFSEGTYEFPSINTTLVRNDVTYYNLLRGRIEEFFVDYASGYTVLSIDYANFIVNVIDGRFELNRRANIPLVENTRIRWVYPEFAITTVFPSVSGLNLDRSRSSAFFDQYPKVQAGTIGPVVQTYLDNLNTTAIELFITASPFINRLFIQTVLCDFGVTSNDNITA